MPQLHRDLALFVAQKNNKTTNQYYIIYNIVTLVRDLTFLAKVIQQLKSWRKHRPSDTLIIQRGLDNTDQPH